ncbi:FAD-dependent 5-carboxymethylaminomethyl-2-thiouridine(34) oxidoreductase MnmC [Brevundimonas sp.]|uniref:FAD-dependent 5-carboxymethylaminomethyl-2-thiouridine(34) oxidoreductase MnmC n=1 Tax=Brevundimonas sp. TaxID=1871086 RepID=UPI002ABA8472|nr:FAD-dependent 5-carboxymethylaminomethyl-2-thiouridine(34) oxidoreductase MnmC [Brevundimonas sp.]MDZ4362355.1 FAD-dependent 5-carboxymethylaminomethyl-2-thiouridine(34) oxidoreductase MnmC [Brevundimonas sp.]
MLPGPESAPDPDDPHDPSPRLIWTEEGAPRSGRFDDVYFSREDGLAESRAVFLAGCDLPQAWAGRQGFTVAELGFGTGLNIVAVLDLWRRHRPAWGRLNLFSVEAYPLRRDEAERALAAFPEVAETSRALLDRWPDPVPGFHRLDLPELGAVLDLAIGPVDWALDQWMGRADAWFLDGFAPSTNPGMWSPAVFDAIAARSAPGVRVATFTVAGVVRRGLADRGFAVDKRPGHGRKRERLEARLGSPLPQAAVPHVAVVGGGIAGAAMARALTADGARVTLIEAERPGAGASGFPAALVTPRMDAGDAGIAALYAQALSRATALYRGVPDAVIADGVLQLEQSPRDAVRFAKIAAQPVWPAQGMGVATASEASDRMGLPVETGGLWMAGAMAVRPETILADWLSGIERLTGAVTGLTRQDGRWAIAVEGQSADLTFDAVVLAAGWGTDALVPDLGLSPVRGQADWTEGRAAVPVAWGGYAVPTGTGLLFGATHERGETEPVVSDAASAINRATLGQRLPTLAAEVDQKAPTARRAAIRAVTPDRLPLAGAVPDRAGLFVLGGLGSRGFCAAPLLAEHVAALITDRPSPLPEGLSRRVDPGRLTR